VDFIGDFNGDGEDDLIIGAPGNDFGPQEGGRAYIHYGGPSANTSADVILVNPGGGGFGNNLGKVVAGAGDVNGDGYDDVLVGAPGSTQSNRMYLYLGGSGYSPGSQIMPSNTYGTVGSDWTFPAALAGAGDINGDMYADVLVGAYNASSGIGQVEVMLGGPSGLSNLITLSQQSLGDRFGFAVGFAGDQNADGVDDVLVGAPFESSEGLEKGRVYLFHGGSGMDGGADLEFFPPSSPSMPMGHFGISVAGGRDLNADGLADIMIGQSAVRNGGSVGRAYVFFGKAGGDVVLDRLVMGVAVGGELGRDVGLAGDLNGDGLADFVVGAPSAGSTGRIDVYDVRATTFLDCNENGIGDACDIESGFSSDVNNNGIPDACEATATLPSTHRGQLLLRSAYPNPFNPTTVIAFDVPVAGRVQLSIYDLSGRRIRSLVSETMDMGSHRVQWAGDNDDGRGVASGVYIARLSLGTHGGTFAPSMMKLMLLK
jgi:hypothetical protein